MAAGRDDGGPHASNRRSAAQKALRGTRRRRLMTTTRAAVRDLAQVLTETRELAGPAHRAVIDGLPAGIRHVAGYHVGWWDAEGRPCAWAGKALRPALAFACARAAGGDP